VSFTDGFWHHGRKVSLKQSESSDDHTESMELGGRKTPPTYSSADPPRRREPSRVLSREPNGSDEVAYFPHVVADQDYLKFHSRLRTGKVRVCRKCGEVMRRSSRTILSIPSGVLLLVLGSALMVLYGLATNFFQTPWFARFLLPAAYYIGAIFIGVGLLFFFIRERIWYCGNCREVDKR
jgi:hypothetical protein